MTNNFGNAAPQKRPPPPGRGGRLLEKGPISQPTLKRLFVPTLTNLQFVMSLSSVDERALRSIVDYMKYCLPNTWISVCVRLWRTETGLAGVLSLAGVAALSQPASAGGLSPVSNGDKWAGVRALI